MILLVSGATAYPRNADVGHLIVPRARNRSDVLDLAPGRWAMDNGAFTAFDRGAFVWMLEEFHGLSGCLFVTAPDVVGNAAATRKLWPFWAALIRGLGWPPAFVAQDGLEPEQVPWDTLGALFIGGTTAYKESAQVRSLCGVAKARGVWVHWGRVNGKRRYELAQIAGADSFDGTGFSWYPDTRIPMVKTWDAELAQQPTLDIRPAGSVGAADDRHDGIVG